MRRLAAISALIAAGGLLFGCSLLHDVSALSPREVGLADRCADIMKAANPAADINIKKRTSEATGIRTIVARVAGTRSDLPAHSAGHDLAAECQFKDGILTGFRWTKGGPPP